MSPNSGYFFLVYTIFRQKYLYVILVAAAVVVVVGVCVCHVGVGGLFPVAKHVKWKLYSIIYFSSCRFSYTFPFSRKSYLFSPLMTVANH